MSLYINNSLIRLPFLLDSGSQLSMINRNLLKNLNPNEIPVSKHLSGFGFKGKKNCYITETQLILPCREVVKTNMYSIDDLNIDMCALGINNLINDLKLSKYPVSPSVPNFDRDCIKLAGIIGNDILTKFKVFEYVNNTDISLLRLSDGFVPIGHIKTLQLKIDSRSIGEQSEEFNLSDVNLSDSTSFSAYVNRNNSFVNVKICPKKHKFKIPKKFRSAVNFVMNDKIDNKFNVDEEVLLDRTLESLFSLESIGIVSDKCSSYDNQEIDKFRDSIEFIDGKFHIDLPWNKEIIKEVPSNFKLCKLIAKNVYLKNESKNIAQKYIDVFNEQLDLDIIEPVPEGFNANLHVWVPNRPVVRDSDLVSSTKIRPVFNCSLKIKNSPSLNEAAYPGIDLINNMYHLLQWFRSNKYCLLSDLEKAFLQIKIKSDEDKNRFSFIVFDGEKFRYYRYNSIIFGFVSSPFILNYIIKYVAERCLDTHISQTLSSKFYVDNLILTSNDKNNLLDTFHKSYDVMQTHGFNLRECTSNSKYIIDNVKEDCKSGVTVTKVLGYIYNSDKDNLTLKLDKLNCFAKTKREIVSNVAKIFDPLGFVTPLLVNFKIYIQELHKSKFEWNKEITDDLKNKWTSLSAEFNENIGKFVVPRFAFDSSKPIDVIIFADASKEAYGCAFYAIQNNQINLMFSKVKIAPLQTKTLPSLELLASYLSFKCLDSLVENEHFSRDLINKVTLLVDSQCVLSWLLTGHASRKNIFVNNRLKEIQLLRDKFSLLNINVECSYIPSEHNIADILTRTSKISSFCKDYTMWLHGCSWMLESKSKWPSGNLGCIPAKYLNVLCINQNDMLLDFQKFSSYDKLFNTIFHVFRAVEKFTRVEADNKNRTFIYIMSNVQSNSFPDEIDFLKNIVGANREVPKLVSKLNLFIDKDGLLRSKGRISKNIFLSYDTVNPLILKKDDHITNLLIKKFHDNCCHLGINSTLNALRKAGFWILKGRQAVSKVIKNCVTCRRINNVSFKMPPVPALPYDRVNLVKPFDTTGIDFAGPFTIKDSKGTKYKMYILVFTCLNVRAVHMELLESMNIEQFVLAFVRFCNRFTYPKIIYSDNARTFVAGSSLLSDLIQTDIFQDKFCSFNIKFKFTPTYSPWVGAAWERVIRTIKNCIYKTISRNVIDYFSMLTTLSDIERVINSRPLTYNCSKDNFQIITPNDLLFPGFTTNSIFVSENNICNVDFDIDDAKINIVESVKLRDILFEKFRMNFMDTYLLDLRDRHCKSYTPVGIKQSPFLRIGAIVIFKIPIKARPFWSYAKIVDFEPSSDGFIRTAKILKNGKILSTSILNLYPLELDSNIILPPSEVESINPNISGEAEDNENNISSVEQSDGVNMEEALEIESTSTTRTRPLRNAALKFKQKLADWLKQDDL